MEPCRDRGFLLTGATFGLGLLCGCSTIIDVEPDCSKRSECGAYECNDENTACKSTCKGNSDCATGFVCIDGQAICEGGLCESKVDQRVLFSQASNVGELSIGAVRFANGNSILLIPSIANSEVLLSRFDGASGVERLFSGGSGLISLDSTPSLRTPVLALQPDRNGHVRVLWNATVLGKTTLRSVLYDSQTGAVSPAETVYEHAVGLLGQSLRASNSLVDTHVYWVGDSLNRLYALRVAATGQVSGPLQISSSVLEADATSYNGNHHLAWIEQGSGSWAIYHRVASDGADHFLGEDRSLVLSGVGAPPTRLRIAASERGLLVFYQRPQGSGRTIQNVTLFDGGGSQGAEHNWLAGFESIERVEVVQHPNGGALAAVAANWQGERGIWLVQIQSDGASDAIPVRVLDELPSPVESIQSLKLQTDSRSAWVTWAYARDGQSSADIQLRAFNCTF